MSARKQMPLCKEDAIARAMSRETLWKLLEQARALFHSKARKLRVERLKTRILRADNKRLKSEIETLRDANLTLEQMVKDASPLEIARPAQRAYVDLVSGGDAE